VGWRSGAERVPALAAGAAKALPPLPDRCPPARLLPGVARANSTGVGMRMICDVNWDTHRAHTHVYRSTTDCDDAPRSGGIRLDVSLDPRFIRDAPCPVHRAALSASHNATTSDSDPPSNPPATAARPGCRGSPSIRC
jgi:hypothetical protein